MNAYRLTALVLGSSFFFPVSCTTSMYAGTHAIAHLKARDSTRGEEPHPQAQLVAVVPGGSLKALDFSEIDAFKKKNPQASFLLPEGKGGFSISDESSMSFVATATGPETQTIEATLRDETGTFSRYEASSNTIKPLYTRLWYHGYAFQALFIAIAIAYGLRAIGRRMQKTLKNAPRGDGGEA